MDDHHAHFQKPGPASAFGYENFGQYKKKTFRILERAESDEN